MKTCSNCHAPLPADAPGGLCPQCLMAGILAPGDQIQYFGRYELIEEAGLGGMGIVWRARQTGLDRTVALKMIRGGVLADADDVKRFHLEAQAAAQLHHPNIVAIHEIGEHEGQHYYSMDFIEGKNLAELCGERPLSAKRAGELLAEIADAVQFAHQRGILHRDLKPQNVMIDADGAPHLTDFGLAKRIDLDSRLTQTGAVLGSPSYMAPEQAQARADRVGAHTDVYALGAILYEAITGRAPFHGESPAETMLRVLNDEPIAPSKIEPDTPRDLETICLKCLEKEPSRRYATARDFADDVRRFLKNEPILARPASALRKAENWVRRHPWTLAATAAILALVLACTVDFLYEQNRFLQAQQVTPGLDRGPGARSVQTTFPFVPAVSWLGAIRQFFEVLGLVNAGFHDAGSASLAYLTMAWTYLIMMKEARRLEHWRDIFDAKQLWKPRREVSPRMAAVCISIALAGIGYGLLLIARCIEVFVWEGVLQFIVPVFVCCMVMFAFRIIGEALRSLHGGVATPRVSPEELPQIEALIRQGEYVAAVKRVRRGEAGTSLAAAHAAVERIAARLEAAAPGTLVAPGMHRKINVPALTICLCLEATVVTVLYITVPVERWAPWAFDAAIGFALGAGLIGSARFARLSSRILLLLPALVGPFLRPFVIGIRHSGDGSFRGAAYFVGSVFGAMLLLCAFLRRSAASK